MTFRPQALLLVLAWLTGFPALAAEKIPVDLELILAVDISGSIDAQEARMQREGYAKALVDPQVVKAIRGGIHGKIALYYFDWSDSYMQSDVLDWMLIHDQASAAAASRRLLEEPTRTARRTSITGAIAYALPRFGSGAYQGVRKVLDISGDGPNNDGGPIDVARDRALAAGIVINGLPINNNRPSPWGFPALEDLDRYYEGCVIGGPGSFVVVADSFESFGEAVRRKLILEIASAPHVPPAWQKVGPPVLLQKAQNGARYPKGCDIGERQSQEFWRRRMDQ
jgi:hypothetical protein